MVAADLWLPTQINPNGNERNNHTYGIVARLKPGVTMAQARAEMVMIGQRLEQQYPATNSGWGVRVFPMAEMYSGKIRPVLLVLLGAVGLLLLIACADLANLLLARAAARQREIAIRGAMGVGRMRIDRQLMTEGLVLAFPDDLVGLLLAAVSVRLLRGVIPDMFPTMKQMTFDWPVLLFTFGILHSDVPAVRVSSGTESLACGAEHHSERGWRAVGQRGRIATNSRDAVGIGGGAGGAAFSERGTADEEFCASDEREPGSAHRKYSDDEHKPAGGEVPDATTAVDVLQDADGEATGVAGGAFGGGSAISAATRVDTLGPHRSARLSDSGTPRVAGYFVGRFGTKDGGYNCWRRHARAKAGFRDGSVRIRDRGGGPYAAKAIL
jgi:hypothetical protein